MNQRVDRLASRAGLLGDLDERFAEEAAANGLAFLLIKIERFRRLNVIFGHELGDALLDEFMQRLEQVARDVDVVARMGDSEFAMILPNIRNQGHALLAMHKILSTMESPFILDGRPHRLSVKVGAALYPEHAGHALGLLQKAEKALMAAREGMQHYKVYEDETREERAYDWDLEGRLQYAQDNDELELYYQPKICLSSGALFGAEALIRWKTQDQGFVRPDIFIPIAEQSGQIHALTRWVLNTALRQSREWPDTETLKVAINLSASVLQDDSFIDAVQRALSIWDAPTQSLILEITESALIADFDSSLGMLERFKEFGIGISIDDFGTGYSSMSYFRNIPATELKVDRSFVAHMLDNAMDHRIVTTVIDLARSFGLEVVAEGVENRETMEALKELDCDIAQGYYLARPMPQDDFIQWLKDYQDAR
jgi:diguanylate cyclase (GGDEF)-like protein